MRKLRGNEKSIETTMSSKSNFNFRLPFSFWYNGLFKDISHSHSPWNLIHCLYFDLNFYSFWNKIYRNSNTLKNIMQIPENGDIKNNLLQCKEKQHPISQTLIFLYKSKKIRFSSTNYQVFISAIIDSDLAYQKLLMARTNIDINRSFQI